MRRPTRNYGPRVNYKVRAPKVRVILDDGSMLGLMSSKEAMHEADKRGLDLVEISPSANPPVCKIMDFGKYKYEQKKKAQYQKKQVGNVIKEITLSPVTQEHDLNFKVRNAIRFLEDGHRVKFTVRFRGRQMAHPEIGTQQIERIAAALRGHATVEVPAKMEGRFMAVVFAPAAQKLKSKPKSKTKAKLTESEEVRSQKGT